MIAAAHSASDNEPDSNSTSLGIVLGSYQNIEYNNTKDVNTHKRDVTVSGIKKVHIPQRLDHRV